MSEFIFYLSPVLALVIFVAIAVFIKSRSEKVKVVGFDYLWLNNLQSKLRAKIRRLHLEDKAEKFEKLLYNLSEKFMRKTKLEALKIQVWADKVLEKIKERKRNGDV